ncbi:hypothetical protein EWM64_g4179 [Hericium alpestre]|uniref:Uncharacterized protein n=1 Tax=Hericium alpestre TaxID=135208 RepID=A0A4Z0A0H9_9AGAM|nr:hypothetical protein EWM64_g4179 [Hericium alpestre]
MYPCPGYLAVHDVRPEDFSRLLEDCHLLGKLHPGEHAVAMLSPLVLGVGFLPGFFVTYALQKNFKRSHVKHVGELLQVWDEAFFRPRRLKIWIEKGKVQQAKDDVAAASRPPPPPLTEDEEKAAKKAKKANRERVFLCISNA